MFKESTLSKLIKSFQKMEKLKNKYLKSQSEVFKNLEEWANENKNSGIQDVAKEMNVLAKKVEQNSSFDNITVTMFQNFQEYDLQLKEYKKSTKGNTKVLDCKSQVLNLEKEIEASKSILFKTKMKQYTNKFKNQTACQTILYNTFEEMLEELPDISSQDVDDIFDIEYNTKENIVKISQKAIQKLDNSEKMVELQTSKLYPSLKMFKSDKLNQSPPPSYSDYKKNLRINTASSPKSYDYFFS